MHEHRRHGVARDGEIDMVGHREAAKKTAECFKARAKKLGIPVTVTTFSWSDHSSFRVLPTRNKLFPRDHHNHPQFAGVHSVTLDLLAIEMGLSGPMRLPIEPRAWERSQAEYYV
jgi:hypothetical protein